MNELEQLKSLYEQGQPFVTATVVRVEKPTSAKPGAKAFITQDGALNGWVGGSCAEPTVIREAAKVLRLGEPQLLRLCPPEKMGIWPQDGVNEVKLTCMSGGTLEIFLEPHLAQPHLVVIGHHAIVDALAQLASTLEYSITVIGENLTADRFPTADKVISDLDFSQVRVTPNTYIIITSHGNYDELALEALLPKKPAYIALVASKKRSETIVEYLRQSGMPEDTLAMLKCPAGLDFGAITPVEIALSILAEVIQRHRQMLPKTIPEESNSTEDAAQATDGPDNAALESGHAIDPVCGMTVEIASARYTAIFDGNTYYFCSAYCQHKFESR